MAANKINVTLEVDDKGSVKLKQFGQEAEGAKRKAESGNESMIAGFTKVATVIGSVVVAMKAAQQVFEQAKIGEQLMKQEVAFKNLSAASGKMSQDLLNDLNKVSRGMVSNADLIKSAGTSMMLGIPADKLAELMKIAEATSRQTGQTVTEAFNDITLAVGRGSKMILDNLGIIVDVDKANQEYAKTLGKNSEALTDLEKKQAFMNATLKAGNEIVEKIGVGDDSSIGSATRLSKEWKDLMDNMAKSMAEQTNPVFDALGKLIRYLNTQLKEGQEELKKYTQSLEDATDAALEKKRADLIGSLGDSPPFSMHGEAIYEDSNENILKQLRDIEAQLEARRIKRYSERMGVSPGTTKSYFNDEEGDISKVIAEKKARAEAAQKQYEALQNETSRYAGRKSTIGLTKFEEEEFARLREQEEFLKKEAEAAAKELKEINKKAIDEEKKFAEERLKIIEGFQREAMKLIKEGPEESEARRWGWATGGDKNRQDAEFAKERAEIDKEWNEKATERSLYYARLRRDQQEEELRRQQELHRQFSESLSQNVLDPLMDFAAGTQSFRDTMQQVLASLLKDLQRFIFELANTGGKSGGGGLFGTLFSLAGPALGALIGGGSSWNAGQAGVSTGMTTNTYAGGFSGRASGGPVSAGQTYLVGERGPELLHMGSIGNITPNNKLGGNNFNINVNIDGSKGGTREQNDKMAKQIAREVREEVKKILIDERRYGGALGAQTARAY